MVQYVNINNGIKTQVLSSTGKTMSLSEELSSIISRVKDRVSREIPDTGYFRNFAENFDKNYKSEIYAKNIALFVERDEQRDGRAFLGISVLHPEKSVSISTYLTNGSREKILEYINDASFAKELEKTVRDLSESLKEHN